MKKHFMAERFFRYVISQSLPLTVKLVTKTVFERYQLVYTFNFRKFQWFLVTMQELRYLSSFVVLNKIALFVRYFLKDLDI